MKVVSVFTRDPVFVPLPRGGSALGEVTQRVDAEKYGVTLTEDELGGILIEGKGYVRRIGASTVVQVFYELAEPEPAPKGAKR